MSKRSIIIFNSLLLPPSQTFIRDPAEKLAGFTPYYVGSRRVKGLELPTDRTLVINQGTILGKIQEQVFKITGLSPKLYAQLRQLNPLLIHAQFGLSGALALPLKHYLDIPLIVHYRGADATMQENMARYLSLNHWLYYQRLQAVKRDTSLFLTVSEFIKNKLLAQNFPEEKIKVHYHGVDVQHFCADTSIKKEPIVLFVGRLTHKKGCDNLIAAMAQVQRREPTTKLVVIGDGELRQPLETLAREKLSLYDFLGVQPPQTVKHWMNRAYLLAAPSITTEKGDAEGLPNVILEAQAMGLPVVSTFHAGIPEAIIHGETGFLTAEGDIDSLSSYILQIFENPDLWQKMSFQGRRRMENCFDRDRQTRKLENIYEKILGNNYLIGTT